MGKSTAGTVCKGQARHKVMYDEPLMVEQIDFIEWFREHTVPGDLVFLYMNAEGVEYDIMERLFETKLLWRLTQLHTWLHNNQFNPPLREIV